MKFTVTTDVVRSALGAVMSAVPQKSTLPILGNVLLEAGNKELKLSSTDLEISITTSIETKITKKGAVAIPAKTFAEIIGALPQTELEIEAISNRLEMRFGSGDYKISGISADEFPKLPDVNKSKEIKLSAAVLKRMIQKTSFSVSTDETRPALNGVLWQTRGEKMTMVATDGHRLAKIEQENKKLQDLYDDIILPPRALNLLSRLITDDISEVGLIFGENNIIFTCGNNTLSSRIIEGPYPNYEQVIPKDGDKELVVSRLLLADSVKRVAILANTLTHQVKFSLRKDMLELSATNADVGGEAMERIPCQYQNEELDIGYNANYVLDILKQLDCEEVRFELMSSVSAATITSPDKSDDYLCLVMPLRLAE